MVNGVILKVFEFEPQWNLVKETLPPKSLFEDQDYGFRTLYSDGSCSIYKIAADRKTFLKPDLSEGVLPSGEAQVDSDALIEFPLGTDTFYSLPEHVKRVLKSDGTYLDDQSSVRDYLLQRMDHHKFLKDNPALSSFLVDLNWQSDAVITDQYSTLGDSDDPDRGAAFRSLLTEVFKYLPGMDLVSFLSQVSGQLRLERVTDYGFILSAGTVEQSVDQRVYVKLDLIHRSVTFLRFAYPDTIVGSAPMTFSEDGRYMYTMVAQNYSNWTLLRYPLDTSGGPVAAVLSALFASSSQTEPTDRNAYHPVKLFDGDPKTMWIENAPGPGIGENVTVGFAQPMTADEIQFEPGCFWPEYWKQNYRVKQLEVKLDDKVFTANFNDQMVVQSLKLPSAVTFTTAVFTIKDVYPTTKWEDTAISEIAFYNQGVKIDVDYSKYKDFLKKAP